MAAVLPGALATGPSRRRRTGVASRHHERSNRTFCDKGSNVDEYKNKLLIYRIKKCNLIFYLSKLFPKLNLI
jgi:hypothetical protein